MNIKLPALAAFFLVASGCATTGYQEPSSSPGARTREEVHAEAVAAVRNHKSTLQEELEYFSH